jgi:hypothetical protein
MPSIYEPAPQVTGIYPAKFDTDIPLSPTIRVSYDKALSASSVSSNVILLINLASDAEVAITTPSVSYKTITFSPATSLTGSTRYQIVMKKEIESIDGVPQDRDYSWEFTTEASSLSAPTLTSPADQSSLITTATPTAPTFTWEAVAGTPHHYEIQVSQADRQFSTIYWPVGAFDPTETTVSPSTSFATGYLYHWRVRAVEVASPTDEGDYGDWSSIWSFYVGQEEVPHFESQALIDPEARKFYITGVSPAVGDSNVLADDWIITFNRGVNPSYVNSTYFQAKKYNTHGIPSTDYSLSGTFAYSNNIVVFTPTSTELESGTSYFAYNTEYSITMSKEVRDTIGNRLAEDIVVWFSSAYEPLYLSWVPIRVDLGTLIDELSNDIICRFIQIASLEVNRMRIPLPTVLTSSITPPDLLPLSDVLAEDPGVINPYDVMTYIRARTEWMILQRKRFELLETIDTRRILGSLTVDEASVGLLEQIKKMQDELKATADAIAYIIGIWTFNKGKAVWASKSSRYLPYPYFWSNMDYAAMLNYRRTGSSVVPIYNYASAPSANYISRTGLY